MIPVRRPIDPGKIARMDYQFSADQNPEEFQPDDYSIEDYDAILKSVSPHATINMLLANLGAQPRWIDYCCGQGMAVKAGTKRFNSSGAGLVSSLGVELRPIEGMDFLEEPAFLPGKCSFYQHDLDDGALNSLNPDLITCINGLSYLHDPVRAIEQMYAQIKRGVLLFTLLEGATIGGFWDVATDLNQKLARYKHLERYALRALNRDMGSTIIFFIRKPDKAPETLEFKLSLFYSSINPEGWRSHVYMNA